MKVLVTGGAGYIGSVVSEQLLNAGHEVTVFDNLERGHRQAVDPRAVLMEGDLRNAGEIDEAVMRVKPAAVLHFAAYALVGESMEHPQRYFENNLVGGMNLAAAMIRADVPRLVFSSTCATYGVPAGIPIDEKCPQHPENPYGESKLGFEKVMTWYARRYDLKTVFLRYFNAAGATERFGEDHEPETHLIPNVLRVALGKKTSVSIFGDDYPTPDGTCIRDYVHIADLAEAHLLALDDDHCGAYNLGYGTGASVRQVLDVARRVTGCEIPYDIAARRSGDPPSLVAAGGKAISQLGWNPKHTDLETIIESAWRWMRRYPDGYERAA